MADTDQDFTPEYMLLEANIKEFGAKIGMICALEIGGKLRPDEAYALIRETWKQLKVSRRSLFSEDRGGEESGRGENQ